MVPCQETTAHKHCALTKIQTFHTSRATCGWAFIPPNIPPLFRCWWDMAKIQELSSPSCCPQREVNASSLSGTLANYPCHANQGREIIHRLVFLPIRVVLYKWIYWVLSPVIAIQCVLDCDKSQSVPFLSNAVFNSMHQNGGNTTFLSKSLH